MKAQLGRQCELVKGHTKQVAWLPLEFAVVNNVVDLKQTDDTWNTGWKVAYTFSVMPMIEVRANQRVEFGSLK